MGLFVDKKFTGHSGGELTFKIECDALDVEDYQTLAKIVADRISFSKVIGVPSGGIPFAEALQEYCSDSGPLLIVDDVLTTGTSMEEALSESGDDVEVIGVVIFARGKCPIWVKAIFQLCEW